MKPDALDRRVSLLRTEDGIRRRGKSFGSTKRSGFIKSMLYPNSLETLWDSEPKRPAEIIQVLGLTDRGSVSVEELFGLVLDKADSDNPFDRDFIHYFFLSYIRFCTSENLLDLIMDNFMGANHEKSVLLLNTWVTTHWNSFSVDYHVLSRKLKNLRYCSEEKHSCKK
eukprot:TRINITY_DN1250_c0_g1_i4.p1 TRINITY_DN1250_c0_g1~~TRINITY_DN1250_c0_g1_i4.p1  ORF type:complete len:168 (+),score=24.53 TRINITY_DN1250_c0_g1_i4:25-528(+)